MRAGPVRFGCGELKATEAAELFGENGVYLTKLSSERIQGWSCLKEWLKVTKEPDGTRRTFLHITRRCANLLRCLPLLLYDKNRPGDAATVPHEITHAPDALRYFAVSRIGRAAVPEKPNVPRLAERLLPEKEKCRKWRLKHKNGAAAPDESVN